MLALDWVCQMVRSCWMCFFRSLTSSLASINWENTMPGWLLLLLMVPIGAFASAYGTLIGAGGGFLLVPILLFIFPQLAASEVTSISLAMAFFNAVSGSISYLRLKRVDVW